MRPCIAFAAMVVLLTGLATLPGRAQGPDLPPLPRLQGVCQLSDGPAQGWSRYTASSLSVRVSFPAGWSAREVGGRLELVAPDRVMARLRRVHTGGLSPVDWLRDQARRPDGARCRMVILGGFQGRQCFDSSADLWTTYLAGGGRVLAVEVPGSVTRQIHCGILMGIEDLSR